MISDFSWNSSLVKCDIHKSHRTSSRVCCLVMPTMRTRPKARCGIEIKIEDCNMFDPEIITSWGDNSLRTSKIETSFCIVRSSNNQSTVDLSTSFTRLISDRYFNTSLTIISCFEIIESNISNSFGNGSISAALPSCEIVEIGSDEWILPPRIIWFGCIIHHW